MTKIKKIKKNLKNQNKKKAKYQNKTIVFTALSIFYNFIVPPDLIINLLVTEAENNVANTG